jgi:hypothetical protein
MVDTNGHLVDNGLIITGASGTRRQLSSPVTSLDSESLLLRTFDVQLLQLWRLAPRRQEPAQLPDHIESSTLM